MKTGARWLRNVGREWAPVIIAVLLIRSFVVEAFMVPTGSMLNTILIGDFMLVNKFVYGAKLPFTDKIVVPVSSPKRGDIVIFRFPLDPDVPAGASRLFPAKLPLLPLFWSNTKGFFQWYTPLALVKRCVAVAGDTVEYRDKQLHVNGQLLNYAAIDGNASATSGVTDFYGRINGTVNQTNFTFERINRIIGKYNSEG